MKKCAYTSMIGVLVPFLFSGCGQAPVGSGSDTSGRALPDVVTARVIGLNSILVEFSAPVGELADEPSSYVIRDANAKALAVHEVGVNEDRTEVRLTTAALVDGVSYTMTLLSGLDPVPIDPPAPPRVVGAVSTSSTTVLVTFSNNMRDGALDPTNYFIVQEETSPEAGVLHVTSAVFLLPQKDAVELTTLPQNEVAYNLHVVNVRDVFGTQLAPPELLVDPSRATFRGRPTSCRFVCSDGSGPCPSEDDSDCPVDVTCICETQDTDGDGLPDHIEQRGWTVEVELTNREGVFDRRPPLSRDVTSDPLIADTDGDGLSDFTERELGTDPRNPDTDGDGLTDEREFNLFFSNPVDQDTDEDHLDDFLEVSLYKTSPILADTDGDGLDDDVEILELNRNPRLADLPEWEIDVGNLLLQIDERYTFVDETGETVVETTSTSSSFVEASETSKVKFNSKILRTGWELGGKIGAEYSVKDGFKGYGEISGKGFRNSDVHSGSDTTSTQSLQNAYESSLSRGREFTQTRVVTREVFGASISAPLTVRSTGDIAFTISNLELSVLQLAPDRVSFVPIATLVPNAELLTGEPTVLNLGPLLDERGPINLGTQEVFPSLVENLMRAPQGPVIVPANFDITDEFGRNFAFTSQETNDRTATIIIDQGDGTVEQFNVAIAGSIDDKDFIEGLDFVGGFDAEGKPNGIPMDYALQDIIGLTKETDPPVFDSITAGENGLVETTAGGDDVQVFNTAIRGLSDISVIITAGDNGVLDTTPQGDDTKAVTEGYATSVTCNEFTKQRIIEPDDGEGDGLVSSIPESDDEYAAAFSTVCAAGSPNAGNACTSDNDCDDDADCDAEDEEDQEDCVNKCNAVGQPVNKGEDIIVAGINGIIDTVPAGDDVQRGPGDLCDNDSECPGPSGPPVCVGGGNDGDECSIDSDCLVNGTCDTNVCAEDSENIGEACTSDADCIHYMGNGVCIDAASACSGREVLKRYKSAATGVRNRVWLVYSNEQIPFGTSFGDIILKARMNVFLGFEQDIDRDGLFARHEFGFGSSDRLKDTDGDGISDPVEVREGWIVDVAGREPYRAFPDPRTADSDGDGVSDKIEMTCGTDPRKRDTDDDGVSDFDELCDDGPNANGECPELADKCTEAAETPPTHLDPLNPDSDGDGLQDGIEPFLCNDEDPEECADPLNPDDAAEFLDADEDGLPNIVENKDGGWDVTVIVCNNTCAAAYDGVCQEGVDRECEDSSPNSGDACTVDSDCNVGQPSPVCNKSRECAANSPNAGDSCNNNSDCNVPPPSAVCVQTGTCQSLPVILCSTDADCAQAASCAGTGCCGLRCGGSLIGAPCSDNTDCSSTCNIIGGFCADSTNNGASCIDDSDCDQIPPTNTSCCNVGQVNANCSVCQANTSQNCSIDAQCILYGSCFNIGSGKKCGGFGDSCSSASDCSTNCVISAGFCVDADNEGEFCTNNSKCDAIPETDFICLPTCDTGADCADCGPNELPPAHVFSDPTIGDTDFDGLPDLLEQLIKTDPRNVDTDGDGLLDFDEFAGFGEFFQNNFLFRGFFLTDAGSQKIGSNPRSQDTDNDGLTDSFERLTGWRVLSVGDNVARDVKSNLLFADSDFDGLSDSQEYVGADGIRPGDEGDSGDATDPTDPDTDGDGVLDGDEVAAGTNPLRPDLAVNISVGGLTLSSIIGNIGGWDFEITAEVIGQAPVVIANNQTFTGCTNDEFSSIPGCEGTFGLFGFDFFAFNVSDLDELCPANATLTMLDGETLVIRTRIEATICGLLFGCLSESTESFEFTDLQTAGFIQVTIDLPSTGVPGIPACEGQVILELIRQ